MEVRMKERNIAHGTRDEPYFARNYLSSDLVAGKTCTCGHVFGQTAGNYQAWMHYTHADHTKLSVHERERLQRRQWRLRTPPRANSSFFNAATNTTAAPALESPVDAPASLPAPPMMLRPLIEMVDPRPMEMVGLDDDAPAAAAIGTATALAVRLAPPPF
jgi:hypothetical protein